MRVRRPETDGGWHGPPSPRDEKCRAPLEPHTEQNHSPLCRLRRWELWIPHGRPVQGVWRRTSLGAPLVGALLQAKHLRRF